MTVFTASVLVAATLLESARAPYSPNFNPTPAQRKQLADSTVALQLKAHKVLGSHGLFTFNEMSDAAWETMSDLKRARRIDSRARAARRQLVIDQLKEQSEARQNT